MNTSENDTCRICGAAVPADSTEKLCPACLMSGALKPPGSACETVLPASGASASMPQPSHFPSEFGDYRLLGLLGRGGMGTVYEAEQTSTGRRVALKLLGRQLDSPEMRQRFLREGRLAARVNHPNSLYIFGSEEIEGSPAITMEVAGSGTLQDRLKKDGPLPVAEAVDAVLDVIAGLESAFSEGVLHRDVKPSNCFVCPDGSVKVGDFGLSVSTLARTDTFVTAHGQTMGTPAFASPEQLRGDDLDVRADIYSVGATLFTLLTNRAPFEGNNAVQVVANAVNQQPKSLVELRDDVPPGLGRVVARCLAKEPGGRFPDYALLRNALLPFSSLEPEPASMKIRASAGWIDYLIAYLPPYVTLMLFVGAEALLVQPLAERTWYSARYYFALFGFGFLYFSIAEGMWGGGLGKRLKGLSVVRKNGRRPGIGRALIRILIPILCVEGIRMPLMMAWISDADWTGFQTTMYVVAAVVCGWIPVLLTFAARRKNGFATLWDLASGTRVVVKPKGTPRLPIGPVPSREVPVRGAASLGPYQIMQEMVPGKWMVGMDPLLRRQVWLLRCTASGVSLPRRNVARPGRLRWLQQVESPEGPWDVLEANPGLPFPDLVQGGTPVPWSRLRFWLHDLATELWEATEDQTLPAELSLDHVWITPEGRAILLDEPWPDVQTQAERISVRNVAGQQRFLAAVAAHVESTGLPLHARPVLQNLEHGTFEKLTFLTGTLRGLLDKPVELSQGIRAGSVFMLPLYVGILALVGYYHDKPWSGGPGGMIVIPALIVVGVFALAQLLGLPFRSTAGHAIFRLAVVDAGGKPAPVSTLFARWTMAWLPLFVPMACVVGSAGSIGLGAASTPALVVLLLWIGAAVYAAISPHRGLHDRLAGTWVVRR